MSLPVISIKLVALSKLGIQAPRQFLFLTHKLSFFFAQKKITKPWCSLLECDNRLEAHTVFLLLSLIKWSRVIPDTEL